METSISMNLQNVSTSNSIEVTERDSFRSLESEIDKMQRYEVQNLKQFELISSNITTRYEKYILKRESPEGIRPNFSAPQQIQNDYENWYSSMTNFQIEEVKIRKQIRELKNKLNDNLIRNKDISNTVLNLQKKKERTERALSVANNYYANIWGMNISIENSTEDRFTCFVNFRFADGMYPIKFIVNRQTREVLEWNARALLTIEEENEMKLKLSSLSNCFPLVLSELRMLILKKI